MTDPPATELTCQELVNLVTDYFDGALPAPERARFEAHLTDCPYCVTFLRQMRQTIRIVGTLTEDTIPPDAREALLSRFREWKRQ